MIHPVVKQFSLTFTAAGQIAVDVPRFLIANQLPGTAAHCGNVAREARRIANLSGIDADTAEQAGWLHDISAVWATNQRLGAAETFGLEILPAERQAPNLLHQKLSVVLARELFGVQDEQILSAVGCHTTLKADPAPLDLVLFAADKLAWDQPGEGRFQPAMRAALEISVEQAVLVFLTDLWQHRTELPVLHPWTEAAYRQLSTRVHPATLRILRSQE